MNRKYSLGQICIMLDLVNGERPDIDFLRFCCSVPEHYEALKAKGFDAKSKSRKRVIPYSAVLHIFEQVFKHPLAETSKN
jgi:hypothetical protein